MAGLSKKRNNKRKGPQGLSRQATGRPAQTVPDPSALEELPITQQAIAEYFGTTGEISPYPLRRETLLRIERLTGRPVICYVTKTNNLPGDVAIATYIEDGDLAPFSDLVH